MTSPLLLLLNKPMSVLSQFCLFSFVKNQGKDFSLALQLFVMGQKREDPFSTVCLNCELKQFGASVQ